MRNLLILISIILISNPGRGFSQWPDTVTVGFPALQNSSLRTGIDTIDSYRVENDKPIPQSRTIQTVLAAHDGKRPVYQIFSEHIGPNEDTTRGLITVRSDDFSLLLHKVTAKTDSAVVVSDGGRITGWVVLPGKSPMLVDRPIPGPVFPVDGPAPWFVTLLPLKEGYSAVIKRYNPWMDAEVWQKADVTGSETIVWNGSETECWKIDGGPLGPPGYTVCYFVGKESGRVLEKRLLGPNEKPWYLSVTR